MIVKRNRNNFIKVNVVFEESKELRFVRIINFFTIYYQGMIDLNILEKGDNYKNLKRSFVIFVCTFDLFGEGRHIYTFENRCIQNLELSLGDDDSAMRMIEDGDLPLEKVAMYSGLTLEQVLELKKELQAV